MEATETIQREALIKELRNITSGCLGSDQFRLDAEMAVSELQSGASSVRVGHTRYYVTD